MTEAAYDRMGIGYSAVRRPEPRIAARIEAALGEAKSVLNVGAGTGSYEPADRDVTAVEPSREMIAQRPPGSAPVVMGVAEDLPFEDDSFDAAMALITVHHWTDLQAGLTEMVRVAKQRVVVLTFTPVPPESPWMERDYFPRMLEFHTRVMPPIDELTAMLPNASVEPVPIPNGCADGFWLAIWDRPEMHLDPDVRRASSSWHQLQEDEVERGLAKLKADLENGRWDECNGHLRDLPELDVGLRLLSAE
ncbi:MAG TPA: class I SAM-dependent methyltransferase, partial [Solirubrobacterales bacterium]